MKNYIWIILFCACLGWQCGGDGSYGNTNSKAFAAASKSLGQAESPLDDENVQLLQYFKGYVEGKAQHKPVYETARDIHRAVKEFSNFVDQLSNLLTEESGGRYPEDFSDRSLAGQAKGGSNITTGGRILGQEDSDLRNKMETLKNDILGMLKDLARMGLEGLPFSEYDVDAIQYKMPLESDYYSWSYDQASSWEDYMFSGKSINTCLAILQNFKVEAQLSAKIALEFLQEQLFRPNVNYDAFMVMSTPANGCVSVGETFKTEISLVNYASYSYAIAEVDGKSKYMNSGKYLYETKATETGLISKTFNLYLYNSSTSKYDTLQQSFSYTVVE